MIELPNLQIEKKPLAEGGSAFVFMAYSDNEGLPKQLVVKHSKTPRYNILIEIEAQVLSNFRHSNVPQIYPIPDDPHEYVGSFTNDEGEELSYILLEYVGNETIEDYQIKRQLSVHDVLVLLAPIADCLDQLHQFGWIHHDLKPNNILIKDEHVYLIDFGLAHQVGTTPEQLAGTVGFFPPERITTEPVPVLPSQDIYSFALSALFSVFPIPVNQLVTYRQHDYVWNTESNNKILRLAPVSIKPDLLRLLNNDPQMRPTSAMEVIKVLQAIESGLDELSARLRDDATVPDASTPDLATASKPSNNLQSLLRARKIARVSQIILVASASILAFVVLSFIWTWLPKVDHLLKDFAEIIEKYPIIAFVPAIALIAALGVKRWAQQRIRKITRTSFVPLSAIRKSPRPVGSAGARPRYISTAQGSRPEHTEVGIPRYEPEKPDEVEFRAYYPNRVVPEKLYGLYVYAHVHSILPMVESDARRLHIAAGHELTAPVFAHKTAQLKSGTPITVSIECPELELLTSSETIEWNGEWQRLEFRFVARAEWSDREITGLISISAHGFEISSIPLNVFVTATEEMATNPDNPLLVAKYASVSEKVYQKIFVSYSRQDTEVVEAYRLAQLALGNDVFVDRYSIRPGEVWQAALARAIDGADVFQLFWSNNAAESAYVEHEWSYALATKCPENGCEGFIRPVYWNQPLDPKPPEKLSHLNFRFVPLAPEKANRMGKPVEVSQLDSIENKIDQLRREVIELRERVELNVEFQRVK